MKSFVLNGENAVNGNFLLLMVGLHASKRNAAALTSLDKCFFFHVASETRRILYGRTRRNSGPEPVSRVA
jgi:hypothetical protein